MNAAQKHTKKLCKFIQHILYKTLTDFEFIRLQNLSIFGLFMKCGSTYFLRSFDKDGHSNR
jgi:hypothetical protein